MSCQTCGHPAEGKVQPHNLGCFEALSARAKRAPEAPQGDICEHDECSKPKKPWSGKGAKPKYCADGHK